MRKYSRSGSLALDCFLQTMCERAGESLAFRISAQERRNNRNSMQCTLLSILVGYFIGCMFGVGCAAAVLHSIYIGGYRKAARDAMLDEKPPRFLKAVEFNRRHAGKGLTVLGLFKLNE
jgi:hypothetical protein